MRSVVVISLLFCAFFGLAQEPILIIGRNTGKKILADGNEIRTFGFAQEIGENPGAPGPTIDVNQGDSVVIDFWNISQGAPHTIHLHGLDVNQENDGVPHLSFEVHHMEHGFYRFNAPHPGTYLYHCHVVSSIHVPAGMYGLLVVRPSDGSNNTWDGGYSYWHESTLFMSEIDTNWHHDSVLLHDYDTTMGHHHISIPTYNPQHFLVNGESEQQLDDFQVYGTDQGNLYLRLANIGYYGNRIIFPSRLETKIVDSDGRPLPLAEETDTVEVYPGERYGVIADPDVIFTDQIIIQYFDLNTGIVIAEQKVNLQIDDAEGIQEEKVELIRIYPNPASDRLKIELLSPIIEMQLVDVNGRILIQELELKSGEIDVSDLQAGAYFISAKSSEGKMLFPFIKQ